MELDEEKLRLVPEGGVLFTLHSGVAVVRRKKHEPPSGMELCKKNELERLTGKEMGSKFLQGTTLKQIVEMTVQVLVENNAEVGSNCSYNKAWPRTIGISGGKRVRGLRVKRSGNGRFAHAYPVDEQSL